MIVFRVFTFGAKHRPPGLGDRNPLDCYVLVAGPPWLDHRKLFLQWLSNGKGFGRGIAPWAFEYTEAEWAEACRQHEYRKGNRIAFLSVQEQTD